MSKALITLTTDFGEASPYVAALKGVILGINPHAQVLDLTHLISPQDIRATSFFLASSIPYFPPIAIHVVVVDPGVGTSRALLYVEIGQHRLLVPDNGCWTELAHRLPAPPRVIRLSEPRYWRQRISATFHGRDILAPVAAWLALDLDPGRLGEPAADWTDLRLPSPEVAADHLTGEVIFVDHFGNLITNIPGDVVEELAGRTLRITVGSNIVPRLVRAYGDAPAGSLVALVSSAGTLEVAVPHGSAASQLKQGAGARVHVQATS